MKKILAIFAMLVAMSLNAQTNALVQFYQTNYTGQPDTNYFLLYKLQPPVLANGSVKTAGFGIRCTPNTNGFFQTNLQLGFYLWTNAFIGAPGIVFTVPQSTNVYNAGIPYGQPGGLAISGYNTYIMAGVLGMSSSNATVTVTPILNSPGFFDLAAIGGTSTNGGTVTSVGLAAPGIFTVSGSPVTVSGTLTFALATELANTVFAGPTSGGALAPTFRGLVASDIPALSYVTSVGLALPNIFNVSGSPVTSAGTLTGTLANESANLFFAGPTTGAAAAPTFRTITLASADFVNQGTTTTVLHGNAAGNPSFGSVALGDMANLAANSVIGNNTGSPATPIALTPSQVLDIIGNTRGSILERAAGGWTIITPGSIGTFLQSQGPGADPIYAAGGSGGSATNAIQTISSNGVAVVTAATNIDFWNTGVVYPWITNRTGHGDLQFVFGTFPSATIRAAITDETGGGVAVFSGSPTLTNATIKGDQYGTNAFYIDATGVTISNNINQVVVSNGVVYSTRAMSSSGFTNRALTASSLIATDPNDGQASVADGASGTFLAGTGAASAPSFRAIVAGDLPALQSVYPQALTNNDNRTGGAVFNESVTFTNNASGVELNPTGTNFQIMSWNTNSAGNMKTNTITMGGLGTANVNFQMLNTNSVQTLLVTQDGALTVGTNSDFTVDTSGNGTFTGTAAWIGTAPTGGDYASNNVTGIATFPSSTNSVPVYKGSGDWLLVSSTPCNFTNATGSTAGYLYAADITVSNSTAAAFTNRCDPTWKARGYAATNALAVLGFNGAVVPASGEIFWHVETRGVNETNFWISY